jgi:hypothetical protein
MGSLLWAASAPFSTATLLSGIFDQLRFQSAHPRMDLLLNFSQRRFGVDSAPFFDIRQDLLTQRSPMLFGFLVHVPPPLAFFSILPVSLCSVYPLAKT